LKAFLFNYLFQIALPRFLM